MGGLPGSMGEGQLCQILHQVLRMGYVGFFDPAQYSNVPLFAEGMLQGSDSLLPLTGAQEGQLCQILHQVLRMGYIGFFDPEQYSHVPLYAQGMLQGSDSLLPLTGAQGGIQVTMM